MSWGRVDDKLHVHEKPEKAGLEAMGLWVLALSHCSDMLTDGFVSVERARRLAGDKKLGDRLATKLVNVRLWHDADQPCPSGHEACDFYRRAGEEGFRFHDWDHYQPNREAVLAEKARKRKNLEDHRDRKRAASGAARNRNATEHETGFTTGQQPRRNHGPSPSPIPEEISDPQPPLSPPENPRPAPAAAALVPKREPESAPSPPPVGLTAAIRGALDQHAQTRQLDAAQVNLLALRAFERKLGASDIPGAVKWAAEQLEAESVTRAAGAPLLPERVLKAITSSFNGAVTKRHGKPDERPAPPVKPKRKDLEPSRELQENPEERAAAASNVLAALAKKVGNGGSGE